MTFTDMEELAKELNAKIAFGLDGGRSSHIAIKAQNRTIVLNPVYKSFSKDFNPISQIYPVGNILVFSKFEFINS